MICGYSLLKIVLSEVAHFGLSAYAGWLGYSLTQIIQLRIISHRNLACVSRIPHVSYLAGLSFAIAAHVLEDYYLGWF